jgi:hypothetical protein
MISLIDLRWPEPGNPFVVYDIQPMSEDFDYLAGMIGRMIGE